jgi:hypothetical protein
LKQASSAESKKKRKIGKPNNIIIYWVGGKPRA